MFSNNFKISDKQLKKMLVFDMISISILIIPYIAASGAGKDGLIAVLIAGIGAICYALLMLYFCKQIKMDYLKYSRHTLGSFFSFLFGLLYLAKFFFSAVFVLTLFTTVIHETILANTSSRLILISLILVSVFYASKMMESRARMVELLYYVVLIPLLLLFLLGFFKVNPANLLPLATTRTIPVIKTSYAVFLTFSAVELILFATPSVSGVNENSTFRRKVIQAIVITSLFNLVVFVIVTGLLGISGATGNLWSTISVMQMIEIPGGFVHRQDALMLSFWLISIFTITSTLFHYLCQITKSITKIQEQRYILIAYAIILFLITMKPLNLESLYYYFGRYIALIGFPQSVFLPLLLILVGRIRRGDRK
ncbi:MAG: GerAB/ArcD/ProY family transporter [Lachnospiraceae bacterium]